MAEKNWLTSKARPIEEEDEKAARRQEQHAERIEAQVARKDRETKRRREAAMRLSVRKALYRKHQGRPPPTSRHMRDANRVADVLHVLFGASLEVIKYRLEEGHTGTAQAIVDRYLDILGNRVEEPLEFTGDMSATDKANLVLERVAEGRLGLESGRKVLEMITAVGSFEIADEIEALKQQLARMGENTRVIGASPAENPAAPSWGSAAKAQRAKEEPDG